MKAGPLYQLPGHIRLWVMKVGPLYQLPEHTRVWVMKAGPLCCGETGGEWCELLHGACWKLGPKTHFQILGTLTSVPVKALPQEKDSNRLTSVWS